jgi:hypothetical protein
MQYLSAPSADDTQRTPATQESIFKSFRLYSRVVQCEIRKIEVYDIDFSRPSPDIEPGRGIHCNYRFGSDYVAISRNRAFTAPKSESPIRRYRAEAALNGPVTDRRVLYATVPSGSGPACKHTAKFEPAAGTPKRILTF